MNWRKDSNHILLWAVWSKCYTTVHRKISAALLSPVCPSLHPQLTNAQYVGLLFFQTCLSLIFSAWTLWNTEVSFALASIFSVAFKNEEIKTERQRRKFDGLEIVSDKQLVRSSTAVFVENVGSWWPRNIVSGSQHRSIAAITAEREETHLPSFS